MLKERRELVSRWFNVLTESEKLGVKRWVHMSWERGSIYFDSVKIYQMEADHKGQQ